MSDIECPYCEAELEINHDDGYGYAEDEVYEQECGNCRKTFGYTTSITFYYEARKLPCQNGEPHAWKKIIGWPKEYFENAYRCQHCATEARFKEGDMPEGVR
jgi:hypothetical protein